MDINYIPPLIISLLIGSAPLGMLIHALLVDTKEQALSFSRSNITPLSLLRMNLKKQALLAGALEISKPILCLIIMLAYTHNSDLALLCAFVAALGHLFPVYQYFKPQKTVLPILAFIFALSPLAGIVICILWFCTLLLLKRPHSTTVYITTFAPFIAMMNAPDIYPVGLSLLLAMLILFIHKKELLGIYPNDEPPIKLSL